MRRGSAPIPLFGLGGLLDVASEMGLDRHYEDFGQTLGRYGVGAGAYVVLPVLGPSTVRDTLALPVDRLASPPAFFEGTRTQIGLTALQIVNTRAGLLGATRVIDDIALDRYTFVRDAYLQRRRSLVFDGDAPDLPAPPDDSASEPAAGAANLAPACRACVGAGFGCVGALIAPSVECSRIRDFKDPTMKTTRRAAAIIGAAFLLCGAVGARRRRHRKPPTS